jgi:hypothetical protein
MSFFTKLHSKIKKNIGDKYDKHIGDKLSSMPPITNAQIKKDKEKKKANLLEKQKKSYDTHLTYQKSPTYNSVFHQTNSSGLYNPHTDSNCNPYHLGQPMETEYALSMKNTHNIMTKGVTKHIPARVGTTNCKLEHFLNNDYETNRGCSVKERLDDVMKIMLILAIIINIFIVIIMIWRLIKNKY